MVHCINRYGAEEVRRWYFEIWNEPDFMWAGTAQDYYRLYQVTAEALIRADPALRLAGAAVCSSGIESSIWVDGFVDFINTRDLPLHCFTFHFYGEQDFIRYNTAESESKYYTQYGGKDYLSRCIGNFRVVGERR